MKIENLLGYKLAEFDALSASSRIAITEKLLKNMHNISDKNLSRRDIYKLKKNIKQFINKEVR